MADVPSGLDLLIAGTACVDFSPLNTNKKTLDDLGESGETFNGLRDYVQAHRPRLVILENVRGDHWKQMGQRFRQIGYETVVIDVDSKDFYIPQTRQRSYMVGIEGHTFSRPLGKNDDEMEKVKTLVKELERKASCPGGYFLLDENCRQMDQIVNDRLIKIKKQSRSQVDWLKAQNLHKTERTRFQVGKKRIISQSKPGNRACKAPEFYQHQWLEKRAEREWELLDITFLKNLTQGFDMNYKERWIDLSQAVNRGKKVENGFGNVSCVTPRGTHFCSTRGGPMTGQEALAIQGLPISKMIFTRESQDNLQELAGNAMTSTIVGVVMLATLILYYRLLDENPPITSDELGTSEAEIELQLENKASFDDAPGEEWELEVTKSTDMAPDLCANISTLQQKATSSSRYCYCEKQSEMQPNILMCTSCGDTACQPCSGNPPHGPQEVLSTPRQDPLNFIKYLRQQLPMRLCLLGLPAGEFDEFLESIPDGHNDSGTNTNTNNNTNKRRKKNNSKRKKNMNNTTVDNDKNNRKGLNLPSDREVYKKVVQAAVQDDVHFVGIKRAEAWTVFYEGANSSLQLIMNRDSIQWLLFAKPPANYPALCLLREIFAKPIAKMTPISTILDGKWKISQPISTQSSISIRGVESGRNGGQDQIQAYPARCGITHPLHVNDKVWKKLSIESSDPTARARNIDYVCGSYELLPGCGTASDSLYKKEKTEDTPAVFLFFDPHRCSDIKNDSFVFAFEHSRLCGYSPRVTIAELSHEWRAKQVTEISETVKVFYRSWKDISGATLKEHPASEISYHRFNPQLSLTSGGSSCHKYTSLLAARGHSEVFNFEIRETERWKIHDIEKSTEMLDDFAWAFEKPSSQLGLEEWKEINVTVPIPLTETTICEICQPKIPRMVREKVFRKSYKEHEDNKEAAIYERLLKTKPPKWIFQTHALENDQRELRFSLNIHALAHLAYQNMLSVLKGRKPEISWRLIPNSFDVGRKFQEKLKLMDSNNDSPQKNPPTFNRNLRLDQRKSLHWMIEQEKHDTEPFDEVEVEEATLPALAWRAEVKVTAKNVIRGGLCADQVGFGKTALILGLIDSQESEGWNDEIDTPETGLPLNTATLIIVNTVQICKQWVEETRKFLGEDYLKQVVWVDKQSWPKNTASQIKTARIVLVTLTALEGGGAEILKRFKWARLVIDEYPSLWIKRTKISPSLYMDFIVSLEAYSKWIVSGTPELEDFADIKSLATLLGVHLGVDDDGDIPSQNKRLLNARGEYSMLEKLQMFRPVRTDAWYSDRWQHAQGFLDRFARQNSREDVEPYDSHYDTFAQSGDERRAYGLLAEYLRDHGDLSMKVQTDEVPLGLRKCFNKLIKFAWVEGTYEHALLLCSISATYKSSPYEPQICTDRVNELENEFQTKRKRLDTECSYLLSKYDGSRKSEFFKLLTERLVVDNKLHEFGDPEIQEDVGQLYGHLTNLIWGQEQKEYREEEQQSDEDEGSEDEQSENEPNEDRQRENEQQQQQQQELKAHRRKRCRLGGTIQEQVINEVMLGFQVLAKIKQDLRFWTVIKQFHAEKKTKSGRKEVKCSKCAQETVTSLLTILRTCGHVLCKQCLAGVQKNVCVVQQCLGETAASNLLVPGDLDDQNVFKHSSKLQKLIKVIEKIPEEDQVLVFCQYLDMFKMIGSTLKNAGIEYLDSQSSDPEKMIERFKKKSSTNNPKMKVLILHLGGDDMAGL